MGKPCKTGLSGSRSVSGILSGAAIHLGRPSPAGSLPPTWSSAGRGIAPIGVAPGGALLAASGGLVAAYLELGGPRHRSDWRCTRWGLPSRPRLRGRWWSLTPPFHPCLGVHVRRRWAVSSLLRYPAGFPVRELPGTVALWCPDFPRRLRAAAA